MRARRLYYLKLTGEVIKNTGETDNPLATTPTIEQDIESFTELSERNRNTFDVLELAYGEYAQEFAECNGYRVNPEMKALEFSYPVPGEPDAPQVFGPPLTEQIADIRADMDTAIMELTMAIAMGGMPQ